MTRSRKQSPTLFSVSVAPGAGAPKKKPGAATPSPPPFHVFVFDNRVHAANLKSRLREHQDFTDVFLVDRFSIDPGDTGLCLLSFDGKSIDSASLMRKSRAVSTGKWLLKFFGIRPFPPIGLNVIESRLPEVVDSYSTSSASVCRLVRPEEEQIVLNLLRASSDEANHTISELEALRGFLRQKFDEAHFRVIAQEKDALILLAEIWGLEREKLPEWTWTPASGATPPSSYVDEITRSSEYRLVTKDIELMKKSFFRGWEEEGLRRGFKLVDPTRREAVIVLDVGAEQVEKRLGVDVFIFSERHQAYTLIQYKAMEIEGRGQSINRRTPQFIEEIRRMNDVLKTLQQGRGASFSTPYGYRLHANPFFFKFVPRIVFEAGSRDMLPGLFIPSDYCEHVMNAQGHVTGTERHLSNTDFIQLMKGGWIGTSDLDSKIIGDLIKEAVTHSRKAGNAVWLASIATYDPLDS